MKAIFKYQLEVTGRQAINMLAGAEILTVQVQHGVLCMWALVDPANDYEKRYIAIYGTGNPVPLYPGRYISTVQQANGSLVWHVFEGGA
jgi:hypothetical protein